MVRERAGTSLESFEGVFMGKGSEPYVKPGDIIKGDLGEVFWLVINETRPQVWFTRNLANLSETCIWHELFMKKVV